MSDKNILIIDDEIELLEILEIFFDQGDYIVTAASSLTEAFVNLDRKDINYDVVLCDQNLSDGKGNDILDKLRSSRQKNSLFYFITGDLEFTSSYAQELGADGVFAKPFDIENVVNSITDTLRSNKS